jgi:solute carrier family 25 thiamine pyrophosphate transporter 19
MHSSFQVQQAPIAKAHSRAKYVGFLQSLRSIHAEEGLKSFWRGNLAATNLWVFYSALQFGSYQRLLALWPQDVQQQHRALVSSANGACAGVMATVVTYPLDLFRTIFAGQGVPKPFPTIQSLAIHTFETRGVRGFYSGIGPTLFQIAPYMGLSFGIYSSLNEKVSKLHDESPLQGLRWALSLVGSGAVAGLLSKLTVYPLDTVKKRMQMRYVTRCASYGVIPNYATSWQCFSDILRNEGLVGLYKGTWPSLLKSVVTHSSTFAAYEVALVVLESVHTT